MKNEFEMVVVFGLKNGDKFQSMVSNGFELESMFM